MQKSTKSLAARIGKNACVRSWLSHAFGDAAHASLPFAGNGAAQALEDAAVLNRLFGEVVGKQLQMQAGAVEMALKAYDEVRRPRSQAVVELARKYGRIYAYAEDGMHEDPERMKAFFRQSAAFTNEFDVAGQNEQAVRRFEAHMEKN